MVREIHNVVRGRTRYEVKGLYRRPSLKERIEEMLAGHADITFVSANVYTGHVLVLFKAESNGRRITQLLKDVVLAFFQAIAPGTPCPTPVSSESRVAADASAPNALKTCRLPAPRSSTVPTAIEDRPWHLMDQRLVLRVLNSDQELGLTRETAEENRRRYGANLIPRTSGRSTLRILVDQFTSLPVLLLGAAAGLSALTGGVSDALGILVAVLINGVIGFVTEREAERTISSLRDLVTPVAVVRREGATREISAQDVLMGDILVLRPGTYVAADARLIEASHLSVDESVLTGESLPASKSVEPLSALDIPLADRSNIIYAGTLVTGGQGLACAVGIGVMSEIGKVQALMSGTGAPATPVERQLHSMGNRLVMVSGLVAGLALAIGFVWDASLIDTIKMGITLAVATIPEGLPTVATTTLAIGMHNLLRHRVLVRDLEAVCTLGSVQTVCFDKTGTITLNRMAVKRICCGDRLIEVQNGAFRNGDEPVDPLASEELMRLIHVAALCNESQMISDNRNGRYVVHGSATENALVDLAIGSGVDVLDLRAHHPLLETAYRAENHLYMSTLHGTKDHWRLLALKGSPVEVLSICSDRLEDGRRMTLTESDRDWIETQNDIMAGDALRVLGVAYGYRENGDGIEHQHGLTWLGLVGMADPIREGVKRSVDSLHRAGIETVMITGDQSPTAYAVGRELDLNSGKPLEILDSTHLANVDQEMMKALCNRANVFARVSPSHKLQIVQALQAAGKVVAMTGDGINDGPALKAADIGIAMGHTGTDVAREVADLVLEEDDLETLVVAIGGGRAIYGNIRKAVHFLLSTNFSEIILMIMAASAGLGYPLNAMQLLWINLLSDIFPALALAMEPPEADILNRPPRDPHEPIVSGEDLRRIGFQATAMSAGALAAYGYGLSRYGPGAAAGSVAFQSLSVAQILHALSCRSERTGAFDSQRPSNPYLTASVMGSLGLQATAQLVPGLRRVLGLTPLGVFDALVIGATALIPFLVNEITKIGRGEEDQ